jgi:hypothetical protein
MSSFSQSASGSPAAKAGEETVAAGEPLADWEKELISGTEEKPTESAGA